MTRVIKRYNFIDASGRVVELKLPRQDAIEWVHKNLTGDVGEMIVEGNDFHTKDKYYYVGELVRVK